jgi:cytochrome c oxidase assembly protein subunit 15
MNLRFRRLLAGTTGLTAVLMLLGVFTASSAAGLTCAGRWPFCDGFLGLFPANWMSFIEWFHRLVAMITGFVILGVAGVAWRRGADRRIRWALVGAIVLLPVQIALGALTVTLNGLFPGGYSPPIQAAHYLTALVIFAGLAGATALAYAPIERSRLRLAALFAAAIAPVQFLFGLGAGIWYGPYYQVGYYALSLSLFAAGTGVAVWAGGSRRLRSLTVVATVLLSFQMLLGRRLLGVADPLLTNAVAAGVLGTFVGAALLAYRIDGVPLPVVGDIVSR